MNNKIRLFNNIYNTVDYYYIYREKMEYMTVIGAEVTEKSVLPIKNGKEISIFVTKDIIQ